jgi:hypothetical protein
MILAVKDIEAARDDLVSRGVDVSEVAVNRPAGFDENARSVLRRGHRSATPTATLAAPGDHDPAPGREWED